MITPGYSIFIVQGPLPSCQADQEAFAVPIPPPDSFRHISKKQEASESDELQRAIKMSMGQDVDDDDDDFQKAMKASMMEADSDDKSIAMAISRSLEQQGQKPSASVAAVPTPPSPAKPLDPEEIRRKRLEKFAQ